MGCFRQDFIPFSPVDHVDIYTSADLVGTLFYHATLKETWRYFLLLCWVVADTMWESYQGSVRFKDYSTCATRSTLMKEHCLRDLCSWRTSLLSQRCCCSSAIPTPRCLLRADPEFPHTCLFNSHPWTRWGTRWTTDDLCVRNSMKRTGRSKTAPRLLLPHENMVSAEESLRWYLKANEETTLQILALTLFPYPSLEREFGKCQRSPWILEAMERFCISPGLTVSADSSHMI